MACDCSYASYYVPALRIVLLGNLVVAGEPVTSCQMGPLNTSKDGSTYKSRSLASGSAKELVRSFLFGSLVKPTMSRRSLVDEHFMSS